MLTLYYTPGACSMAAHIVLEESGEKYEAKKVDLAGGEQRTQAYLKINPLGRVPTLLLDNGDPLAENTAILPFLGNRPERYASETNAFATLKDTGLKAFHSYLKQIEGMLAEREWFFDRYTVLDPYGFVFYTWGVRRQLPLAELKNYTAFKNRMLERPPVRHVVDGEQIKL
jgi:glutathione S-transferase